jgi:hypothetical protein
MRDYNQTNNDNIDIDRKDVQTRKIINIKFDNTNERPKTAYIKIDKSNDKSQATNNIFDKTNERPKTANFNIDNTNQIPISTVNYRNKQNFE